jgi:hypothetical protein
VPDTAARLETVDMGVAMKLFGQVVRTAVNVALLPVAIAKDIAMSPLDVVLVTDKRVGERTADQIERLKEEASE